jgi:hypothetical protein
MEQQNRHPQDIDITIKNIILPLLESKLMRDIIGIKYKRELDSVFKTTKERRVDLSRQQTIIQCFIGCLSTIASSKWNTKKRLYTKSLYILVKTNAT